MTYRDQKTYTIVCIANSYDIKELEAQKYLEKAEDLVLEHLSTKRESVSVVRSIAFLVPNAHKEIKENSLEKKSKLSAI